MKNVSEPEKLESIRSLQSAISKSEKALARISQKGASTTLLAGRLHALRVGLAMLESTWHQEPHAFTLDDIARAREVLTGLLPSIEKIYTRSKAGSSQKTLLERRMKALQLAVEAMDERFCG